MSERTYDTQLTKHLTDVHSIEEQALAQLKVAPRMAGDRELAAIFAEHLRETEDQERLVRRRLDERSAGPSKVKDLAGRAGGWGMALFARANPDTPGKLAMHAFSYEHMEIAAYELLRRFAERAGDDATAELSRSVGAQERAMAERLATMWDRALDASLREKGVDDLSHHLVKYLRDADALEAQALQLLQAGPHIAEFEELAAFFREHLEQTRQHQRLIRDCLSAHGNGPSRLQAGAMRVGALNLGTFFKGQPDTPAKLVGFAYAFEALEVGAYELLQRMAQRAGDERVAEVAAHILAQERAATERVASTWDHAIEPALREQGVVA
ncbi:MAG: ferritin-like domain-containing protein [Actinomycetota bacterium]|nr:ferritin-like domain-containing protein [Actinomycetota bacterium]